MITRRRIVPIVNLKEAHVVITGGSSGIGLCAAEYFADRCSRVTIIARNQKRLDEAKTKLEGKKATILTLSCDLSGSFQSVSDAIQECININGPINVLFNCAGSSVAKELIETDPKVIDDMMRVNYFSSAYTTRAVVPHMVSYGQGGVIAFVSSQAGQIGIYGFTAYSASKFALRGFAEALAMEMAPSRISVSLVFPPDTDTPGFANEQIGKPKATLKISESSGLHSPEELVQSIIPQILSGKFLCSVGLEGWMLSTLTAGMCQANGVLQSAAEVLLSGIFRLVSLFYGWYFAKIVRENV